MADTLGLFIDKKKAESPFLTLADGESIKINKLREIKVITKAGYGGEEKEVLRLVVEVEMGGLRIKNFDNGTQRFAQELQAKGVNIGGSFTLKRDGLQTKTKYSITEVVNPATNVVSPAKQ